MSLARSGKFRNGHFGQLIPYSPKTQTMFRFLLFGCLLLTATLLCGQTPADLAFQSFEPTPVAVASPSIASEYQPVRYSGRQVALRAALADVVSYPSLAQAYGIEGTVRVAFRVSADGQVDRVRVLQSVHPLLDKEAERVVAGLTHWKPATFGNRVLSRSAVIDINFRLP